ncbi:Sll0314/Alr1548 family TPR repeat-containing protein [Myxosarcina sp. GI1]|uniref:Sll0314/Alr1548 family TPR repeat-containing protein n=1 Tax=Myxosarcina sp. GI1 TaxID=1541065 RepID=UPI00056BC086|nr:Sll0314/Alr1548 family TPR repeat-containing protein [Myxosarcina sp. GI1]
MENQSKSIWKNLFFALSLAVGSLLSLDNSLALAADPFREQNVREIGELTESAFKTVFLRGNYLTVEEQLDLAETEETNEPLIYAMQASLAYTKEDWTSLQQYALKTLETASAIGSEDPLRSNLYLAVGHFLNGAYLYHEQGAIAAIDKLQMVFKYLDRAEDIDRDDPELNLIKGYMDLLLAVNLPFSSPEQAIARFETYAAPNYLVNRGIAVAYRDLKQYQRALEYANKALEIAPENPEHYYLKGQILRQIGKEQSNITVLEEALENFAIAADYSEQLPESVIEPLEREIRQTQEKIAEIETESARKFP